MKIYSDAALQHETGIRHYPPKPYLLVTRTGAKEKPIDLSVIYLPDLEDPHYAIAKRGFGTSKLSLKLSNGILTEFGSESDSKVPELITAASGLLTGVAGAFKTTAEGLGTLRGEAASIEDIARAAAMIDGIAETLANLSPTPEVTANQATAVANLITELRALAAVLRSPAALDQLPAVRQRLAQAQTAISTLAIAGTPPVTSPAATWNSAIAGLNVEIAKVIELLQEELAERPTFDLYEIRQTKGQTVLVAVPPPVVK